MRPDHALGASTVAQVQAVVTKTSTFNGAAFDVSDYVGNAALVLTTSAGTGGTLATNGAFASDSGWTKGTGWTIGSGKADCDGTQTAASNLTQDPTLVEGTVYTVTYTVSSYSAGTVRPIFGGTLGTARSANGTYTEEITAGSADTLAGFQADADFVGKLDDVAYSNQKMVVTIDHSVDGSTSWAAVTGATFAPFYGTAGVSKIVVNTDKLRKYIRATATLSGTTPSFAYGVNLTGLKQ